MRPPFLLPGLLAIALVLPGCLGTSEPEAEPTAASGVSGTQPDGEEAGAGGSPTGGLNATVVPAAPYTLTYYFSPDRKLSETEPSGGTVAETVNFLDPAFQTGTDNFLPWPAERALPAGLVIEAMKLDVWISTEAPQGAISNAFGFDPVVIWFGEAGRHGMLTEASAPAVLPPGTVHHAEADISLPPGGFVIDSGGTPSMLLGFGYSQSPAAPLLVHVGGETASRLTLTVRPYAAPPPSALVAKESSFEGVFEPNSEGSVQIVPFAVNASTVRIVATLDGAGHVGRFDIDLTVASPSGEAIVGSTAPFTKETVLLHGVNIAKIGPGDYAFRVSLSGGSTGGPAGGTWKLTIRSEDVVSQTL